MSTISGSVWTCPRLITFDIMLGGAYLIFFLRCVLAGRWTVALDSLPSLIWLNIWSDALKNLEDKSFKMPKECFIATKMCLNFFLLFESPL